MTVMGSRAASAAATAVFPTPVAPTMTGTSGRGSAPPKAPLQLGLGQLNDRGPAVHVVRGEGRGEEPRHQLAHLVGPQAVPRLDGRAAGVGRGEPLQLVLPTAESAAREIAHQLLETGDRKSTRLNSSHPSISYAVFCLKKKTQ